MKKIYLLIILLGGVISCGDDDTTTNLIVGETLSSGGFIRTLQFNNSDLILNDTASTFSVAIEIQDEQQGALLDNVEVYTRFKDNNPDNGDQSSSEVLVKTLEAAIFTTGANNLPTTTLELTYAELIESTQIPNENIQCKDQFLVRLVLNLTDGRSFSINDGASSSVIAFDTIFSSPFCYTLNIVTPIAADRFVGTYQYQSTVDGPIGPTFGLPDTVEIRVGESPNTRIFEANYIVSRGNEPARTFRFVVNCDEIIFRKNQLSSFFSWCRPEEGGGFSFGGPPILLGPDTENAIVDTNDDTTFELRFVEGYLGWDGDCDFGTVPVSVLFTKQ